MAGPSYRFGPVLVDRLRYRVLRDDAVLPLTPKLLDLLLHLVENAGALMTKELLLDLFKIVVSMLAVRLAAADRAGSELSIVSAVFILPFLPFSGYAGRLADMHSKRTVLIVGKSLEIVAATLGLVAFAFGHLQLTYAVLFLIALQATFFSPAKYGVLPEMLADRDLSRANGVLEMSTFVAIVLGTAVGGYLFEALRAHLWVIGLLVVAVAVAGTGSSFGIPRVPPAAPRQRLDRNPWREIWTGIATLRRDRVLWLTVVGISYFWFLGSLLQLVMILFGTEVMALSETWVGVLTAFAAIGIGVGSLVAGRLSGDKVELSLAPIGAIGMGVFAMVLARSGHSFPMAAINLTIVGFFGGFFAVPLNALLQQRSGGGEKGRLMATNNFLNTVAIMLASAALSLLSGTFRLAPDRDQSALRGADRRRGARNGDLLERQHREPEGRDAHASQHPRETSTPSARCTR